MVKFISSLLVVLTIALQIAGQCGGYFKEENRQVLSNGIVFSHFDDFDNDGKEDLLGVRPTAYEFSFANMDYELHYYKRLSANSFDTTAKTKAITGSSMRNGFLYGDVNGDGFKDLVVRYVSSPASIVTYLNDGSGNFSTALPALVADDILWAMSDLNGDGKADLIVTVGNTIGYRPAQSNNGFGSFVTLTAIAGMYGSYNIGGTWLPTYQVMVDDLNGDGLKDIAFVDGVNSGYTLKVLTNTGNPAFTETASIPFTPVLTKLKAYDLNNDGKKDFVSDYTFNSARYALNNGNNTFTTANLSLSDSSLTNYGPNYYTRTKTVADFDNDGDTDIIFQGTAAYTLFRNQGNATFIPETITTYAAVDQIANLDNDGRADGIFLNYSFFNGNLRLQDGSNTRIFPLHNAISFRKNVCNRRGQTRIIDFLGDGVPDRAFWNPSSGYWRFYNYDGTLQTGQTYYQFGLGSLGDVPAANDYDGDGKTDFAIYRKSNGTWWIAASSGQNIFGFNFGTSEDKPVPADYDGDGKADIALYRPSNGTWHFWLSATQQYLAVQFGIAEDKLVPSDYDGDGKADIAVYRPSTGVWYVLRSSDGLPYGIQYGISTDVPVPGDYDGDGKANIAAYRNGVWYVLKSDYSTAGIYFGTAGDVPFFNNSPINPTVGVYRSSNSTYHLAYTGLDGSSAQPTGNSSGEIFASSILPQ